MQNILWTVLLLCFLSSVVTANNERPEVIPKVGVYISAEDIISARETAATLPWAKELKTKILKTADSWVDVSDEYIREIMPDPGSIFAYGIAGCPDHNVRWANFGGNGIFDLNRPNVLRCPQGHEIDFDNPESKYYDSGNGVWIGSVRYFFRGVYNSAIVNLFTGWGSDEGVLHHLAYAYALTGDQRYAKKAAVIFDELAHLNPTTKGPRDFHENDAQIAGRMHFLTSIVHRSKVHFVRSFDLLYNSRYMQQKSFYSSKTVAENVAEGLLLDYLFEEFDLRNGNLSTLHNHESDELRGMLATGLVLGIPEYIKWGLSGASFFFENTICKDGLYYEGAPSYAIFTQSVFADIAELAYYYNPDNYPEKDLPPRVNFYDHSKLREFLFGFRDKVDIAGHMASFGNSSTDRARIEEYTKDPTGDFPYVDRLYHRTDIPEQKLIYEEALLEMSQGDPDSLRSGTWALFHVKAGALPTEKRYREIAKAKTSYFSGSSLAILESGEGRFRRGLVLRGGPNLPHSHDDSLGLLVYDKGYLLTQDNGYNVFGSPLHSGWGSRAISHNLVVVDNDRYRLGWYKNTAGASLYGFVDRPGFKYVHLDNPNQFSASAFVKEYSRRTALIDISAEESYIFDVFTVQGGSRHDYAFHTGAPKMEAEIDFDSLEGVWTLAGLDNPGASYDKKGQSWGERILPGDMILDLGIASEGVKSMYWTPAPGNGYGFIYDLKKGALEKDSFTARFKYLDGTDTTLTNRLFFDQKTDLYTGLGPNLAGTEKYPYLILRSESAEKHSSRVISVMDASYGASSLTNVERIAKDVFLIETLFGQKHYIILGEGEASTPEGVFKSSAEFTIFKFEGDKLTETIIVSPETAEFAGETVIGSQIEAEVVEVDWQNSQVILDGRYEIAKDTMVVFDSNAYARNTAYRVTDVLVEKDKTTLTLEGSLVLAKGTVLSGTRDINLNVPLPTGFSYESSTKYLDGKGFIREKTGEAGIIRSVAGFKRLFLRREVPFSPGDGFVIVDIKEGDTLKTLPYHVQSNN